MQRVQGVWKAIVLCLPVMFFTLSEAKATRSHLLPKKKWNGIKELVAKVRPQQLKQLAVAAALGITVCMNLSCAGRYEVQPQVQYTADELVGMHVHFTVNGVDYVGEVSHYDGVHAKKVMIDLYDGRMAEGVPINYIKGTLIPIHEDNDVQVYLQSDKKGWRSCTVL